MKRQTFLSFLLCCSLTDADITDDKDIDIEIEGDEGENHHHNSLTSHDSLQQRHQEQATTSPTLEQQLSSSRHQLYGDDEEDNDEDLDEYISSSSVLDQDHHQRTSPSAPSSVYYSSSSSSSSSVAQLTGTDIKNSYYYSLNATPTTLELNALARELTPQEYEKMWKSSSISFTKSYKLLKNKNNEQEPVDFEKMFGRHYIYTLASGQQQSHTTRIYLYAEEKVNGQQPSTNSNLYLLELILWSDKGEFQLRFKMDESSQSEEFISLVDQILKPIVANSSTVKNSGSSSHRNLKKH